MGGLPAGIGLTYTAEFRSRPTSPTIHALNVDMQFIALENTGLGTGAIGGEFGLQYSIGSLLPSGARFYVDLIGLGAQIMGTSYIVPFYVVNLLGFQHTTSSGFYWGLRSKITITDYVRKNSSDTGTSVGFGAYLAIGYDFGKKINPKDYEPRSR